MINVINTPKLSTQNLRSGEKVLKQFKQEFPYLRSNTRINLELFNHKDNENITSLTPKLKGRASMTGFKIYMMRQQYASAKDKIGFLTSAVKKEKSANCAECAILMHDKLAQNGIKSQNVRLNIQNNVDKSNRNHAFTVFGLDKNANISKPHTWGKNAIIVDGWANIAKKAQEGVEYLKQLFQLNTKEETCVFEPFRNI